MMTNKTGFTARGYAHPEIKPGDIYRDNKGRLVTVDKCEHGRVYFIRDGFPFATELLARVQVLRAMINASREASK
ncbi:DUF4222 domain-containing protein [Salmonella enterica]|nr:DUF4222 domain-containing protein [Salmonella enterica]ECC3212488.1 DUF4222 domain-containing protein [Salmonella enterica subsp. diarizonae]EDQ3622101.1 DUF4222 domain-containing protein [Salmonella enterica subsp. diarizonae]